MWVVRYPHSNSPNTRLTFHRFRSLCCCVCIRVRSAINPITKSITITFDQRFVGIGIILPGPPFHLWILYCWASTDYRRPPVGARKSTARFI